jgi:PAS domain S-box-containing protein
MKNKKQQIVHSDDHAIEFDGSFFSRIFEQASDAFISADDSGAIRLFNAGAEQIFGYRSNEVIGQPLDILLPEEFRSAHKKHMARFANEENQNRDMNRRADIVGQRKDGSRFPAKATISCVQHEQGRIFSVYLRDISDLRQIERESQQARDELAHMGRIGMLGEISSSLAHELNQPLAAILTNSQVLKRHLEGAPGKDEGHKEIVADIVSDAKRAGAVIERLRSLMRPGVNEYERLEVNKIVTDVKDLLRSETLFRQIDLQANLASDLPAISGDRIQLQQVLLNLVSNASDAMLDIAPEKRVLIIISRRAGPDTIELAVKDNGVGLGTGKHRLLFEPYYTTKDRGMGMGLAISKTIMQAHGGKLWAENNRESGATFYFSLPVMKVESDERFADTTPKTLPVVDDPKTAKVFIVDDDEPFREALARLIEMAGYAVEVFASADEFLQRELCNENACLLMDLHMPEQTGLELQQALNAREYSPPIIFITGAGDTASGVHAMKMGAMDFLSKPVDEQRLLEVIGRGLEADRKSSSQHALRSAAKKSTATLTSREKEVMALVTSGQRNKQIAHALSISEKTVKVHRGRVMQKVGAGSLADLVRISELAADPD